MRIEGRFIALACGNATTFFKDGLPKLSVTKVSETETRYTSYTKGEMTQEAFVHQQDAFANLHHRELDIERLKLDTDAVTFFLDATPANVQMPVYARIEGRDGVTWLEYATLLASFSPSNQLLGIWNLERAQKADALGYLFSLSEAQAA